MPPRSLWPKDHLVMRIPSVSRNDRGARTLKLFLTVWMVNLQPAWQCATPLYAYYDNPSRRKYTDHGAPCTWDSQDRVLRRNRS